MFFFFMGIFLAWSIVLNGNDFIGISETGSGKTLAFLLPAIIHVKAQTPVTS
jgi:ATP-dependent RNA helicase DDX5/DBP2